MFRYGHRAKVKECGKYRSTLYLCILQCDALIEERPSSLYRFCLVGGIYLSDGLMTNPW